MGLDQYFCKTKREEIGYFRKVNFLQKYFEWHAERDINCEYVRVTKEMAQEILTACKDIIKYVSYPEKNSGEAPTWRQEAVDIAREKLPTQDGFFYGGTDYDAWYFLDVKAVHDFLENLIEETNWEKEVIEYTCWY